MGMPTIEILFQQLAATAVNRSGRGVLALVIRDETAETKTVMEYATSLDIKEGTYTKDNTKMIKQAFTGEPAKVIVVKIGIFKAGKLDLGGFFVKQILNMRFYLRCSKLDICA